MRSYVPRKGDYIAVTFDPQSGHEQKGRRPALVVSNTLFNEGTGLAIVCPLTTTDRNFPFHVAVLNDQDVAPYWMPAFIKGLYVDIIAQNLAPLMFSALNCLENMADPTIPLGKKRLERFLWIS